MTRTLALLAVLTFAAAGFACAQAIDPIETRQAGQDLMITDFGGMRAVIDLKGDVKKLENPAKAMARWMKQFPSQFPPGTETGHNTRALPAIWSDRPGFEKAANNLVVELNKLAEVAKAGDAEGAANQLKAVDDACVACHRAYRGR